MVTILPLFRSSPSVFAAAPRWDLSLLPFNISWPSCADSGPVANKFYEVQKYVSLTNHMWDGFWTLANGRAGEDAGFGGRKLV
jgi:hypothetical protein